LRLKSEIICYQNSKFEQLRLLDKISNDDIRKTLSVELNRKRVFKAGEGSGGSGSFFFFSYDNKLLIKTISPSEKETLLKILDPMIEHIKKSQNKSLLARIYGLYQINTNIFDSMTVIVMQNTLMMNKIKNPSVTFDLKGSKIGRYVKLGKENHLFWRTNLNQK